MTVTQSVKKLAASGFSGTAAAWYKAIPGSRRASVWHALQILCAKHQMRRQGIGRDTVYVGQRTDG